MLHHLKLAASICPNGRLRDLALSVGLLSLLIALGPSAAASSVLTAVALDPGNGSAIVNQSGANFASLSVSSSCGAAQGFANAADGTVGVSDSTVPGCSVPVSQSAYADAQVADGWTTSCSPGCSVSSVPGVWDISMNGTFGGLPGDESTLTFQDTLSVDFAPAYVINIGVTFVVGGVVIATGSLIDEGSLAGDIHNPTTTTFPVIVTGNTLSVDLRSAILLSTGGFSTHMDATAVTNGSIDFYDPIQQTFTSTNPNIQFVSNGGDSTSSAPEPGSFILFGTALVALGVLRRQKHKTA